jgi:hypothetical protein
MVQTGTISRGHGAMRKSADRDWEAFGKSLWIPECGFTWRDDLLPVNGFEYAWDEEPSLCHDAPWLVADLVAGIRGNNGGLPIERRFFPLKVPDIHRRFAALNKSKTIKDGIKAFADEYGTLGHEISLYNPRSEPRPDYKRARGFRDFIDLFGLQISEEKPVTDLGDLLDESRSRKIDILALAGFPNIEEPTRRGSLDHRQGELKEVWERMASQALKPSPHYITKGQSLEVWVREVFTMSRLVDLWESAKDVSCHRGLRAFVKWTDEGSVEVLIDGLGGFSTGAKSVLARWSHGEIIGPILHYIHSKLNREMANHVAPVVFGLPATPQGISCRSEIRMVPDCLLGAMYVSFALEIANYEISDYEDHLNRRLNLRPKRCAGCNRRSTLDQTSCITRVAERLLRSVVNGADGRRLLQTTDELVRGAHRPLDHQYRYRGKLSIGSRNTRDRPQ